MKHTIELTPDTIKAIGTIELGPETLRALSSISWHLKRMADAWENTDAKQKEEPTEDIKKEDGKRWTRAEEKCLRHLFVNGRPADEIAEELGRSKMAVYSKISQLGYKRNIQRKDGWTEEEDKKLLLAVKLHGQNWSDIARLFKNRTNEAIRSRFKKLSAKEN